jgi:hypothetical protein
MIVEDNDGEAVHEHTNDLGNNDYALLRQMIEVG